MSREEADAALAGRSNGTFLVRFSSQRTRIAVSHVADGRVSHVLVYPFNGHPSSCCTGRPGQVCLHTKSPRYFDSFHDMILAHPHIFLLPFAGK